MEIYLTIVILEIITDITKTELVITVDKITHLVAKRKKFIKIKQINKNDMHKERGKYSNAFMKQNCVSHEVKLLHTTCFGM